MILAVASVSVGLDRKVFHLQQRPANVLRLGMAMPRHDPTHCLDVVEATAKLMKSVMLMTRV